MRKQMEAMMLREKTATLRFILEFIILSSYSLFLMRLRNIALGLFSTPQLPQPHLITDDGLEYKREH